MIKRIPSLFTWSLINVSCLAGYAHGEIAAPTLKISGSTVMNMYAFKQRKKVNGTQKGYHLANDSSNLVFLISGKVPNLDYKYKISIESLANKQFNVQQNYIEFISSFGALQIGAVVGPEDTMIDDGGAVVEGTGTFDGAYKNVYNLSAFAMRGNDNIGDTGYNTKIVYYTPLWNNFRFGLAYTPSTAHRGDDEFDRHFGLGNTDLPGNRSYMPAKQFNPYGLDVVALGLSYKRDFGLWNVNVNGAYVHDRSFIPARKKDKGSKRVQVKDVNAYQLGTVLSYTTRIGSLLQLGAGWYDNGHSRLWKKPYKEVKDDEVFNIMRRGHNGRAWNIALGYTFGAYKAALSYQQILRKLDIEAKLNKIKTEVLSGTFDVIVAQGLKFYLEGNYIRSQTTTAARLFAHRLLKAEDKKNWRVAGNNSGAVFILGTKVSF
jgi:hypothetical protein